MDALPPPTAVMTLTALTEHVCALSGAAAAGVAHAVPVEPEAAERYERWIAAGHHSGMAYLDRYHDVRRDPRLLLEGASSLIVCAFPYLHPEPALPCGAHPRIARYARGRDYHEAVRERLTPVAQWIDSTFEARSRICVDTAPLRERYWAVKAGLGFVGRNNTLIIPGQGSYFFLGVVITTALLPVSEPCTLTCGDCMACLSACPGHALRTDGALDARRCVSYLTIEHRGPFPAGTVTAGSLAGCDVCQEVCPHNRRGAPPAGLPEFAPASPLLSLSNAALEALTEADVRPLLRHSALSRIKPADLLRNIHHRP